MWWSLRRYIFRITLHRSACNATYTQSYKNNLVNSMWYLIVKYFSLICRHLVRAKNNLVQLYEYTDIKLKSLFLCCSLAELLTTGPSLTRPCRNQELGLSSTLFSARQKELFTCCFFPSSITFRFSVSIETDTYKRIILMFCFALHLTQLFQGLKQKCHLTFHWKMMKWCRVCRS